MKLLCVLVLIVPLSRVEAQSSQEQVKAVLAEQTSAWNSANLVRFAATYADHCTLVGSGISEVSRDEVLAHYRKEYPTPQRMGHLTFSDMKVRLLDADHAVVVARWRLDRGVASGGVAQGVFSLVLEDQHGSWLIILDHTS
jgi:uncharacterized protein (TIGR02246 family)